MKSGRRQGVIVDGEILSWKSVCIRNYAIIYVCMYIIWKEDDISSKVLKFADDTNSIFLTFYLFCCHTKIHGVYLSESSFHCSFA